MDRSEQDGRDEAIPSSAANGAHSSGFFTAVKQAVDKLDPMGLLDMGAPPDEYDGESRSLVELIRADMSSSRMAGIMADEFSFSFGEHFSADFFLAAAGEIKAALEADAEDIPWQWCLVGNIVQTHEYGEEHEIRAGTKQFGPGAKVYVAPAQWGDGYERACVIGKPRGKRGLIEAVMKLDCIENFRLKKVFQPTVLERMEKSPHSWWGSTDRSRDLILALIASIDANRSSTGKNSLRREE